MANTTSAAGNNGVAGTSTQIITDINAVTGSVSGGNLASVGTDEAIRSSVAKTSKGYGSAVAASNVYSVTQGLRFAYAGVEADAAPGAITRA